MFRFEMSRAGSVTERVKQRERWRGEKQNQEGWFTKVDERHFLISRLLEDTGQEIKSKRGQTEDQSNVNRLPHNSSSFPVYL